MFEGKLINVVSSSASLTFHINRVEKGIFIIMSQPCGIAQPKSFNKSRHPLVPCIVKVRVRVDNDKKVATK